LLIPCPYCKHGLNAQSPKPGKFTTRCVGCQKRFVLIVPDDPNQRITVAALKSELAAEPAAATTAQPTAATDETRAEITAGHSADVEETVVTGAPRTSSPTPGNEETLAVSAGLGGPTGGASASQETAVIPSQGDRTLLNETAPGVSAASSRTHAVGEPDVAGNLGGYQIEKLLGRGGMGAVYLARQLSLDRQVALKTMRPEWARNPTFVSRFVREAYAAAQLSHHNVVQIYDFGEDKGTNFFSMEFVPGRSLNDLVREHGKLDPEVAVGYILQAARGLKFAHDRGMIHRDVKPDNLMVSDLGIVKVADLGLVKTPASVAAELASAPIGKDGRPQTPASGQSRIAAIASAEVTAVDVAMGTPAYMAPEQARDAASVDVRADIYSLGCTLYTLVTGRPPFQGTSAMEVMTKHQTQPITPPDLVVKRVPPALSALILKMVAKKPEERYSDLNAVINDLEGFLGVFSSAAFTPREEHAQILETAVNDYHAPPLAKLRPTLILGYLGGCLLFALLFSLVRKPLLAGGFIGLGLMTSLAYFLVLGITRKTYLFQKVRELAFGSSWGDWLTILAGVVLLLVLLFVFKLLWVWVAFCIAAVLIALGFYREVDRKLQAQREDSLIRIEDMLKTMRLHGLEEDAIRQFVCRYSGERWEEIFEDLFGYEDKLIARERWGRSERARSRPKFGAWREPVARWIDAKQKSRREAAEKEKLQALEEKSLVSQGVNLVTARRQSRRSAEAMVTRASELRTLNTATAQAATLSPEELQLRSLKSMLDVAAQPEKYLVDKEKGLESRYRASVFDVVLGSRVRFLAGAVLLAGCVVWMYQNGMLADENVARMKTDVAKVQDINKAREVGAKTVGELATKAKGAKPLRIPMVPSAATTLFKDFNPGVAGLLLIASAFFSGWRLTLFVVPAAAIIVLGRSLGLPDLGPIKAEWSSLAVGLGVAVIGVLFARGR
jgi:eukaryotic-like serine/threonine-protein kinase